MRIVLLLSLGVVCLCAATARGEQNKMCPVMTDQPTRADRFVDYQGRRVYFCCEKCMARFEREPAKFLANLDPAAPTTSKPVRVFSKPIWQLFGRLHVVIVHFPIALIILAGLIELVRVRKPAPSDGARAALTLGAIAAVLAACMGWVDAANQFDEAAPKALVYHRWLGVALTGISIVVVILAMLAKHRASLMRPYRIGALLCAAGVGVVGHFGGTLTYGDDYYTAIFRSPSRPAPNIAPQPREAEADATQVLLFGSAKEMRETRINLRLAKLPPPPVPPRVSAPTNNAIDQFIVAKWEAAKLEAASNVPSVCDDATFARRVYLDVIGVIPTIEELTKFLDDKGPDKRDKLVDALLARNDDYAAHWTPSFEEGIASSPFPTQGSIRLHGNYQPWILESFKTNRPYDVMVGQLIDPTEDGFVKQPVLTILGKPMPVGYIVNDTHKDTLQSAANFGQFFLGTGMKCASCHSHFTNEEWPQTRFIAFASMFGDKDLELIRCEKTSGKFIAAHYPFDLPAVPATMPSDVGQRLHMVARLSTDPANPRFAKTTVNRLWKRYLGLGLFEPADDFRLDSPAANSELLDWLAYDFVKSGYDLKHNIRLILTSRTYQLKYDPKLEDHFDVAKRDAPRYWRSPTLRKLTAEQLLDSMRVATAQRLNDKQRLYHAIESTSLTRNLGRPPSRNEIATARADDVAIVQSLELLNGKDWSSLIYASEILSDVIDEKDPAKVASKLYRAALSRSPNSDEVATVTEFLKASSPEPTTRPAPVELVWVDDDLPLNAKPGGSRGPESWKWTGAPEPVQHGVRSHTTDKADAQVQHLFLGADPLRVESNHDVLFCYVYLDPDAPPTEIMLQWNDGNWEHRAFWGANSINFGEIDTPSRMRIGNLPGLGKWVRLEVPIAKVGLTPASAINGISFDQVGGKVYWDSAGIIKQPNADAPALGDLLWALFTNPEFQYVH